MTTPPALQEIGSDALARMAENVRDAFQPLIDGFAQMAAAAVETLGPLAKQLEREQARAEVATIEATARLQFRAEGDRCAPLAGVRFDASGLPLNDGPEDW